MTDTTKDLATVRFALNFFDPKPDPESEDTAVVTCAHEALNRLAAHLESGGDTKDEKEMLELIDERDAAEESLSQAYYLVTGKSPEWSNLFGHKEALEEIEDACFMLRKAIKKITAPCGAPMRSDDADHRVAISDLSYVHGARFGWNAALGKTTQKEFNDMLETRLRPALKVLFAGKDALKSAGQRGGADIEVNQPFERLPVCACDTGSETPPTSLRMKECKISGGPCAERYCRDNPDACIAAPPACPICGIEEGHTNACANQNPYAPKPRRWRHVKRGSIYTEIGRGVTQSRHGAGWDEVNVVIYRGDDGQLWVRAVAEFEDGRFEEVVDAKVS